MGELLGLVFSIAFVAGVLGNLTAAVIWGAPMFWGLHRKLDRHHREHLAAARPKEET
jgi:hypothetical protein